MTDGPVDAQIAEAEQKGFIRGLNVGFVCIAPIAAGFVCWRLLFEAPRYEEVFRQVKVPIPVLTLLVLNTRGAVAVAFFLLAGFCIWATRKHGQKRFTIVINALFFGGALFWLLVVTLSLQAPMISLLEGIGQRRP